MSAMFHLVAEPRRQEILRLVWRREMTAGDIAAHLPVTFSAVSQHLRVLRDNDLVDVRRDGKRRWYRARREQLGPIAATLEALWTTSLDRLAELAEAEEERDARR
jgi:DNA-binding transcriptional ArsR family regulator